MVERSVCPVVRAVALLAGLREIRSHVVGTGCALEIRQMATHARRSGNAVVVVDVAVCALPRWHRVHPRERKSSGVVVECRVCPVVRAMALLACLRETRGDVIGIRRTLEILQVAAHACVGANCVVVVDMAIGARTRRYSVHSREREIRKVVVEGRIHPGAGSVALVASLRKIRRNVIGIRRALEIFQVTSCASRTGQRVVAVDMAIGALTWRHGVQSGQREAGRGVVELSIAPLHDVVALFARCRKAAVGYRCGRAGEILLVTAEARHRAEGEIVVDMAVLALTGRHRVPPGKNKPR